MGFGTSVNKCYDCGEKYRINDGHVCRNSKSNSNNSDEDCSNGCDWEEGADGTTAYCSRCGVTWMRSI